ncbi:alpha/beta hydrolase [Leptospira fluminis]|uniref:Alpha/beta hydrolase n=1 Tax=Leptospira fluminis TaxID=2484979 RepID=A0A4R9GLN2_9LEPT|nr:alpha/beta hydrolase [Leptospira fluminis]TGK15666.1 alpha/beta hydrolase [Leptospira fluminis]
MQRKTFQFRGLSLSYIDAGRKKAPPVLIAHANGYSAGCYRYYTEKLSKKFRVLALDFCGHGESQPSLEWKNWSFFRDQILALVESENLENCIGIGHSMGGASLLLSSYVRPEKFRKIIALDPVVLDIKSVLYAYFFRTAMAKGALSRRREFSDLNLIRRAYRKRSAFANWDDGIFEDYLKSCFRKEKDKVVLRCPPELEAKIFNSANLLSLFQYPKIKVEAHITIPEKYEVCSPKAAGEIVKGNRNSTLEIWPNATHFFPFEEPERTWNRIRNVLGIEK